MSSTAMQVAVLGSAQSWYLADLQRAGRLLGDTVVSLPFSQLSSRVLNNHVSIQSADHPLEDFDAILVRSMPPGSLEQVIFRMDALLQLESKRIHVLNPPRSLEASIDKYVSTARLANAGLRVPDTIVCQTVDHALAAFEQLDRDVVIKPIFGSEGRGIARVTDEAIAIRIIRSLVQTNCVFYLQRFIPHRGVDLRLFVLGEKVLGMARHNSSDWRTNVSRGGKTEALVVTDELRHEALIASKALGTVMAGVDFLDGQDGHRYAIEVNAVPGWRALSKTLNVDIAKRVLTFIKERHSNS